MPIEGLITVSKQGQCYGEQVGTNASRMLLPTALEQPAKATLTMSSVKSAGKTGQLRPEELLPSLNAFLPSLYTGPMSVRPAESLTSIHFRRRPRSKSSQASQTTVISY